MDARKQQFRLGLFVVAATLLLGAMIVLFGGAPKKLFSTRTPFTVIFTDAPGVSVGTPVRRSGVKIGEVTAVDLDDTTGKVRVGIVIDKKYTLRSNEEAVISQDLLSRDTTIDFVPRAAPTLKPIDNPPSLKPPEPLPANGVKPASFLQLEDNPPPPAHPLGEPLPPGAVIQGRPPTDVRGIFAEASNIIPLLELGIREFTLVGRGIREIVPEIRRTNDEIRTIVQNARTMGPSIRKTNDELQLALRNFSQVGESVNVFVQSNQDKVSKAIDQSTDVLQRVSQLLSEENQKNITATLRATQAASANFDAVVRNADELLKEGQKTAKRLQETLTQIEQVTKPLGDRGERILRNLDVSIDQFARIMTSFGGSVAASNGDGTVQRFFSDPSLFHNLNNAACMVTKLIPRLDRILADVEVFADKIARHPESIGVGGAVRPNSGLKESPSVGPPQPYRQRP